MMSDDRPYILIEIDDKLFLDTFESFEQVIVPQYNRRRFEKGLKPLTDDQKTNLFLELREKHGIKNGEKQDAGS